MPDAEIEEWCGRGLDDGWFAGFTSKLICVVWVGFDDNRDFKLEGAHSALPIWTEFMKRAHQHRPTATCMIFEAPDGVVTVDIDADTGELAAPNCPRVRSEVFIAGTQPVEACKLHGGGRTQMAGWEPVLARSRQTRSYAETARTGPRRSCAAYPVFEPAVTPPKRPSHRRNHEVFSAG